MRTPQPSIHARELQHWNRQPQRHWQTVGPRVPKAWPPRPRQATQTHHILGFHPYWMGTNYLAYDWSTLHTVVFFSLEVGPTGAITDDHGWPWTGLVQHAHAQGARVVLAATSFVTSELSTLLGSASHRSTAVANLVNAMVAGNADGICLDFEAIPGTRKQQYVDFAEELRSAMTATLPQSMLVITTPAVDWNNAYDYDELALRSDHLLLMAYDYHWSGSSTSGPVAPLSGWGTYNVSWSIQDHFTWGAPADKLLLGVPYYGYRWNTTSGTAGAATTSSGTALTYGNVQAAIPSQEELWDVPSQTPWLRVQDPGWRQTWFDDAASLSAKYTLAKNEGLAGVGIWALGYDDPYTELWNALHTAFDQTTADTADPVPAAALRVLGANPFRGQVEIVLAGAGPGLASAASEPRLRIFDARGRLVCAVSASRAGATSARFPWNGHDRNGVEAPPGLYLAVWDDPWTETRSSLRLIKLR